MIIDEGGAPKGRSSIEPVSRKKLGEKFYPFDPDKMPSLEYRNNDRSDVISIVQLETNLPKMPISPRLIIGAIAGVGYRRDFVTPFDPKAGYQITNEDFQSESRLTKLKKPGYRGNILLSRKRAPLHLEAGITPTFREDTPELRSYAQRLRMQIFIPGSPPNIAIEDPKFYPATFWEAPARLPISPSGQLIHVDFRHFYPLDTGPLAKIHPLVDSSHNHNFGWVYIGLPKNSEKLKTIAAQFILVPMKLSSLWGSPNERH